MQWTEVKEHYPSQWVIIEAINAKTEGNKRVVDQVAVVKSFKDNNEAIMGYVKLHKEYKDREFYVVHTSREQLNIQEQVWMGVRASR